MNLSYESLEDNSFQVVVNKKVNGIPDISVLPLNKKFFSSKIYNHLMNLNLHKYSNDTLINKKRIIH